MIWNPDIRSAAEKSPIVAQITAEIAEACGDDLVVDPARIDELARAVETFLENEHGGESADSRYIVMLASRALSSIGEGDAGKRLLVFGTGLVKPSEWEVTGDDSVLVLDLKEMMIREDSPLELIFFASLGMVIEAIAGIWDKAGGQGVLGLKNVYATVTALLGSECNARELALLGDEIRAVCERKLEQLKAERNWSSQPRVMNLDIGTGGKP